MSRTEGCKVALTAEGRKLESRSEGEADDERVLFIDGAEGRMVEAEDERVLFTDGALERRTEGSWVVLADEGRKLENLRDGVADDLVPCVEGAEDALTITVGGAVAKGEGRELLPTTPEGDLLACVAIVEGTSLDDVASIEGRALAVVASGEGGKEELPAVPSIEGTGDGRMLIPRNGDGADVRVGNCVGPNDLGEAEGSLVGVLVVGLLVGPGDVGIGEGKSDGFGGADGSLVGLLVVGWNDVTVVGLAVAVASTEGGELAIDVPCKSLNLPLRGIVFEGVEGLLVAPLLVGLVVAPCFEGLTVAPRFVGKTIRVVGLVVGTC